jgi:hypothetical protein
MDCMNFIRELLPNPRTVAAFGFLGGAAGSAVMGITGLAVTVLGINTVCGISAAAITSVAFTASLCLAGASATCVIAFMALRRYGHSYQI